jgi:Domain of unknown function (DUF6487)
MKCPFCKKDQWIEGKLSARSGVSFVPEHPKFLAVSYPRVAAHACGSCGHVRLSVDVEVLKSATKE